MAWILRARPPVAELTFGSRVRATDAGVFEGTWVGEADELGALRSTTTFGSGVLVDGATLNILPPGHMLEGVYICQREGELIASNSLVGLLVAADLQLDLHVAYPPLFNEASESRRRRRQARPAQPQSGRQRRGHRSTLGHGRTRL